MPMKSLKRLLSCLARPRRLQQVLFIPLMAEQQRKADRLSFSKGRYS